MEIIVGTLRTIWEKWKQIGQVIGDFIARIVLSLFYFTIFVPFALGIRLFGNPLGVKGKRNLARWIDRKTRDLVLDDGRRQF